VSWPVVELGNVVKVASGFAFKSKEFVNNGYPIIRISNITGSNVDIDSAANVPAKAVEGKEKFIVQSGDILVAMSGATTGKLGIVPNGIGKAYLNQRVGRFGFDEKELDSKYLFYFLMSSECQIQIGNLAAGAAQPNISGSQLESIKIPLPPLPVQKQIAAVLEKADTLRSQCQQMEKELNSLAQSVFLDMFGDYKKSDLSNFTTLGDCANVCSGVTKGQKFGDKPTVTVPYMRVANVQDGYLDLNEIKEIEAKITDYDKYLLKVGDVLMTEGGDFDKLGRGAVWEGQVDGCIHQNHVFRVRLGERYLPKFFEYLLQSQYAKQYFLKCAKKTTNLASINITQLKSLPMPQVDLILQQEFVSFISKLDEHKQQLEQTKQQLDDNFNSLMQRAFKGELDLKDVA
jgi:type I restriction enzyme S subunit